MTDRTASYLSSSTESSQYTSPCNEVDSDTPSESISLSRSSSSSSKEKVVVIHEELPPKPKPKPKRTYRSALAPASNNNFQALTVAGARSTLG